MIGRAPHADLLDNDVEIVRTTWVRVSRVCDVMLPGGWMKRTSFHAELNQDEHAQLLAAIAEQVTTDEPGFDTRIFLLEGDTVAQAQFMARPHKDIDVAGAPNGRRCWRIEAAIGLTFYTQRPLGITVPPGSWTVLSGLELWDI